MFVNVFVCLIVFYTALINQISTLVQKHKRILSSNILAHVPANKDCLLFGPLMAASLCWVYLLILQAVTLVVL